MKKIALLLVTIIGIAIAVLYDYARFIQEETSIKFAGAGAIGQYSAHKDSMQKSSYQPASQESKNTPPAPPSQQQSPTSKLKIIKNAKIRFQVKDYAKSKPEIDRIIKKYSGYCSYEVESNTDSSLQDTITIRVPYENFEALVKELLVHAIYIDSKTITAEDVTEKFIDLEARLKAKKEVEKRYYEILRQAKNVEEILNVESELAKMREDIEAMEGKLRYLSDQVVYSSIELSYYQTLETVAPPPLPKPSFFRELWLGMKNGGRTLKGFIIGLVSIWPFLFIIFIIYIVIKRHWAKTKKDASV